MLPLVGAKTDAEGRARLPAMPRKGFLRVQVTAEGLGMQHLELRDRSDEPAERTIKLRAAGRIEGRLLTDRPERIRGALIGVPGETGDRWELRYEETRGHAIVFADADGRFVIPEIASGNLRVLVVVDQNLPVRPRLPKYVHVAANETTKVEIPLERAVRVRGSIRVKETGQPVASARIHIGYGVFRQGDLVVSDEAGRFETYVLAGDVRQHAIFMPGEFLQLGTSRQQRHAVPADADLFELPPIEVLTTTTVEGRLIDETGKPVAGALVDGRPYGSGTSDEQGNFTLHRVPPNAGFEGYDVYVREGDRRLRVTASVVQERPLILRIDRASAREL